MLTARPYAGAPDLVLLQEAVAAWRERSPCGYLHPGDVAHRIYNALRRYDAARVVRLWRSGGGVAGFAVLWPHHRAFDVQAAPERPDVLAAAVEWSEAALRELLGPQLDKYVGDVWECDTAYGDLLEGRGYRPGSSLYAVTCRGLADLPDVELPDGFTIRSVTGPEEAGAVAEVHSGAFGSDWTADQYRRVMESPGYDAERELVAVAPGGRLAGFCNVWFDHRNGDGLFEPVGVHEDFRRLGLGRALLTAGMRRMRAAGMETATLWHEVADEGASALYAGAGFTRRHLVVDYARPVSRPG